MKTEELQALGLTEEQIKEVFRMNGKDIDAEKRKTEKAETDRDQWKAKAENAAQTLKGFDGVDVEKLNADIKAWQEKAEKAEQEYKQKLYERDFADVLNAELDKISFTSEAAKRDISAQIKAKNLTMEDGKIIGLGDVIDNIRKNDASAFTPDKPTPQFTDVPKDQGGNGTGFDNMSLSEKMAYANANPSNADVIKWLSK